MNVINNKRKAGGSLSTKCSKRKQPRRVPTWSHTFVCLGQTTQDLVPDTEERAVLLMAGLGEKRIQFPLDSDARDIQFELSSHFPKLMDAGGHELLRAREGGGKLLIPIVTPKAGYSVNYLKSVVHNAKIYIRPLQRNLSLEPVEDEVSNNNMFCTFFINSSLA